MFLGTIKIFQKKLQNGSCSIVEAITFGWLARWDVKYEWSYSNLDESLDYEVMVVWYSPSRILMIFKTNNHFLSVEKCCVVREIAKFLKSSLLKYLSIYLLVHFYQNRQQHEQKNQYLCLQCHIRFYFNIGTNTRGEASFNTKTTCTTF